MNETTGCVAGAGQAQVNGFYAPEGLDANGRPRYRRCGLPGEPGWRSEVRVAVGGAGGGRGRGSAAANNWIAGQVLGFLEAEGLLGAGGR